MAEKLKFFAEIRGFRRIIEVFAGFGEGDKTYVMKSQSEAIEPGCAFNEPFFKLSIDEAQNLVDELWRCGIRPTEGAGSAGSMQATERHLKDMQNIAFRLLDKSLS